MPEASQEGSCKNPSSLFSKGYPSAVSFEESEKEESKHLNWNFLHEEEKQ